MQTESGDMQKTAGANKIQQKRGTNGQYDREQTITVPKDGTKNLRPATKF